MNITPFCLVPALFLVQSPADPWGQVVDRVLTQWDERGHTEGLTLPKIPRGKQASFDWLLHALANPEPKNPFPAGHRSRTEVARLLSWVQGGKGLPVQLQEPGSQALLWRTGVQRVRSRAWGEAERCAWEDRMLMADIHQVFRGLALRHALCFVLARNDMERFRQLKEDLGAEDPELFQRLQVALASLGQAPPALRLWSLPDLAPVEVVLNRPGIHRILIAKMGEGRSLDVPEDTLRIIPSFRGESSNSEELLDEASRQEVGGWVERLGTMAPRSFLAPSQGSLARLGIYFFPAVLELDGQGRVSRVLMGDAALAEAPR